MGLFGKPSRKNIDATILAITVEIMEEYNQSRFGNNEFCTLIINKIFTTAKEYKFGTKAKVNYIQKIHLRLLEMGMPKADAEYFQSLIAIEFRK